MIVCDKVWVWCWLLVSSPVTRVNLPWLMKPPGDGISVNWGPFQGSVFRQIRGVQRKSVPAFAVFQSITAQNNQYTKAAYFEVACPEFLQSCFGVAYATTLQHLLWIPGCWFRHVMHGGTIQRAEREPHSYGVGGGEDIPSAPTRFIPWRF